MTNLKITTRFDEKGRRLTLFGRQLDDKTLEIFRLVCSKHDKYNKKVANSIYQFHVAGTLTDATDYNIIKIDISNGDTPHYAFHRWAKHNSYKKIVSGHLHTPVGGDIILDMKKKNAMPHQMLASPTRIYQWVEITLLRKG